MQQNMHSGASAGGLGDRGDAVLLDPALLDELPDEVLPALQDAVEHEPVHLAAGKVSARRGTEPFELCRARSRLYRNEILKENTRWKALAEIFTMHSFTLL